jgi:general secretion pathway protein F
MLKSDGLFASHISAKAEVRGLSFRRARISEDLRIVFTRQMAVLLAADLPSDVALEAVQASGAHANLEGFAADTKAAVMEGQPLSDALIAADPSLPRFYTAAVRAGETSGDLALVFEELANYLENAGTDKAQIATALIYPAFVAGVSLLVCAILMINVAPEIVAMFEVSGRELPQLTKVMLGISEWIQAHWLLLLLGVIGLGVSFKLGLRRPAFRDHWHGLLLRTPVVGRLMRLATAAQYLRTLALIIASRQTLLNAAESAADIMVITRFKIEADKVVEAIRTGQTLSDALRHLTVIPPVAQQLISAGEASARLAGMSERAAVLVENWLSNERKRFAALLDPILMMLVGAMVLAIVLSVLLPIFDLQSVIGQ